MTDNLNLYFRFKCFKGLRQRGLAEKKEYVERLNYELEIITSMDFAAYFLVVSDIVQWAIANQIPVGPGRGSCAGALVSYVLFITHIDPIKYGLIFERFLNPQRISMPDADLDFCEIRRTEIVHYIQQKYGRDKVAHIGTYGSMKAKGAIRDVTRTLGYEYSIGDKLARLTLEPIEGKPQPLSVCYEKVPELNNIRNLQDDSIEKKILFWAEKVENRLRSFGTHASGIVISDRPITELVPISQGRESEPTTQFEMYTIEEVGLIKFDILGLRALTTINRCCDLIKQRHNKSIDILNIPVDDSNVYKMLQQGDVEGIFQLEGSSGIRDLILQIRPTKLEDLALIVSIYRPGPLGSEMLQHYLKVRSGEASPSYLVPELETILGNTDGMLIYQEQILEICKQLAGYTMGEADLMRRAIGKKKKEEMDQQKEKFINGMILNGFDQVVAEKIFTDIEVFAGYGFNKSHAVCYAYIGYQMAYLKCYYPIEFICACLISDTDEPDKIIRYINYCRQTNLSILPPDINESQINFSLPQNQQAIRFGLSAIKYLGAKPVESIITERNSAGKYNDLIDFANRIDLGEINKRKLEALILSGCFDFASNNRNALMQGSELIYKYKEDKKRYLNKLETYKKHILQYQEREKALEIWNALSKEERKGNKKPGKIKEPTCPEEPKIPIIPDNIIPLSAEELLVHEKELLGFYISGHPLDNIVWPMQKTVTIQDIKSQGKHKQRVRLIAIPSLIKEITTKQKKQKMAYMVLEDKTGTIEGVILPEPYQLNKSSISTAIPGIYDVFIDVTDGDLTTIHKLRINNIKTLQFKTSEKSGPIKLHYQLPLSKAKIILDQISNVNNHYTQINSCIAFEIMTESKISILIKDVKSSYNKEKIESIIKEAINE